jgi:transcriptional regulator with XRE-family HTH domain
MEDTDTKASFGSLIRDLRETRGMTHGDLAAAAGLEADAIRRLEDGLFSPNLETVRRLCLGLGLELSALFYEFESGGTDDA